MAQLRRRRWGEIRVVALLAMALVALTVLASGCERRVTAPPTQAGRAGAPAGRLQEVPPPGAVQQLQQRLADRRPRLQITSPAEGALLPAGPWQLGLQLEDWPLVQDSDLGLGPHLVVQVDGGPAERVSGWSQGDAASGQLTVPMAALTPGSHRISVYAALPWGEAVKRPGASAQLRVDRVAANPISQPVPGSAQLLAVSQDSLSQSEPVLIDWLLRDAPLQGLREGDERWRLRISVNGDSFLVNQNTPLWLRGLKPGSNALLMELLDGLGEPLNAPFNSLVREIVIQPGAPRPVWLNEQLSPTDEARLLGQAPREEQELPRPSQPQSFDLKPAAEPIGEEALSTQRQAASAADGQEEADPEGDPLPPQAGGGDELPPTADREDPQQENSPAEPAPEATPEPQAAPEPDQASDVGQETTELASAPPAPGSAVQTERIQPRTKLIGTAREQVREDGSLIRDQQAGPLSGLTARLRP